MARPGKNAAAKSAPAGIRLEDLWELAGFVPNARQKQAILHVEGPLYLPAGPGSGKTRVLLWRTLNLVVYHGVEPDEIFLSTFTEKASRQLKEGLRTLIGAVTEVTGKSHDISRMYVGTVHSLCQLLLTDRRFSPRRQRAKSPLLMDDLGQYLYLYRRRRWEAVLEQAGFGDGESANREINAYFARLQSRTSESPSRHDAVSNCIQLFNRLSEECIDPKEVRRRAKDATFRKLLDLYQAYRVSLSNDGVPLTDFPLIQQEALARLHAAAESGSAFQHVIIDEYQDTNTVQERLFFKLASGHKNICVVGDDDQALYRFRGATVENFVDFPARCRKSLKASPTTIVLSQNYRSRKGIVDFYNTFIQHPSCDWHKDGRGSALYRVAKDIRAERGHDGVAVVASTAAQPDEVCPQIAALVRKLLDENRVADPNQIAFLFPSLKSQQVGRMREALEAVGLRVYAPRARRFLEVDEASQMFGLLLQIFGKPTRGNLPGDDYNQYHDWLDRSLSTAGALIGQDVLLQRYVSDRRAELDRIKRDFAALKRVAEQHGWEPESPYDPETMKAILAQAGGLSKETRKSVASPYFDRVVRRRQDRNQPPFRLRYVINRATSLDWSILDLFYQLCGFRHFRAMFDLAERGEDEGPVCNLSLVSRYLSRFLDENGAIVSGEFLSDNRFVHLFFGSYVYALFRRGESEYEDAEDPFPKGRIPFLTIHQAKGLEFPVVVLGNPRKRTGAAQVVEQIVNPLLARRGEPLDRMTSFDVMRMFYVAISRAQNLLVVSHFKGRGQSINSPFREMFDQGIERIPDLGVRTLPKAEIKDEDAYRTYSYTGDYLLYKKCPRQYMLFRKFDFAPSRSQTMFFGRLVHETLEDLHQHLIDRRSAP